MCSSGLCVCVCVCVLVCVYVCACVCVDDSPVTLLNNTGQCSREQPWNKKILCVFVCIFYWPGYDLVLWFSFTWLVCVPACVYWCVCTGVCALVCVCVGGGGIEAFPPVV